jgi:hypothetical protein
MTFEVKLHVMKNIQRPLSLHFIMLARIRINFLSKLVQKWMCYEELCYKVYFQINFDENRKKILVVYLNVFEYQLPLIIH